MRLPASFSPLEALLSTHFDGVLSPGQQRTLAAWVAGTLLAGSACLTVVVAALVEALRIGRWHRVRQALQELLKDGAELSAPGRRAITPEDCFAPLLGCVLSLWRSPSLALAIDATAHTDALAAIVVSVLYRGRALPVAWHLVPGNTKGGALIDPLLPLLERLAPQTQHLRLVTVAVDRGLWSPRLADCLRRLHWQPLMRVQNDVQVWVGSNRRVPAHQLVAGPGHAWVGRARVHKHAAAQRWHTVLVVWTPGHKEAWVVFTDLPPRLAGLLWYGLRMWIEAGFRDLKRMGWQWERTRRREPMRVSRHWLVLALATLWTLATGTATEEATASPRPAGSSPPRPLSVFQQGRFAWLGVLLGTRQPQALSLAPDPWPEPAAALPLHVEYWTNPEQEPDVNLPL
jgi:hypothetical protein